jgi:hypothetical protein
VTLGELLFLGLLVAFLTARLIFVVIPECRMMRRLDEERHRTWLERNRHWLEDGEDEDDGC